MSSSPSTKQRSPKRTSPKRTPLKERSHSQANEISGFLARDPRIDQENSSVYNSTPFPTKAAHVLLPSTLRNQRAAASPLTETFGLPLPSDLSAGNEGDRTPRSGTAQPTVRLKRSVKALRDLYESQAEENSRPSTATSPLPRPSTASSSRLRSVSSNDSLSGPYAWESLRKISSDDLALLPSLPQSSRFVKRLSSRSSFTSVSDKFAAASSPNYRVLGATSSPRPLGFRDVTSPVLEPFDEVESTDFIEDSSSSPNVIRLARTSSTDQFQSTDSSSSPNVIKLGTSSPTMRVRAPEFVSHSRSSSTSSRKRKRSDTLDSRSFADRAGARNPLASSPPVSRYATSAMLAQSSPAERDTPSSSGPQSIRLRNRSIDESSPVMHVLARNHPSSDDSSVAETHASLQDVLSSSPPRIQYPIIRAPLITQQVGLIVPKRNSRSMSTDASMLKFSSRLSAVPSEASWTRTRRGSRASFEEDDLDDIEDLLTSDELAPASTFIINESANQSMIRVVPGSDSYDLDSHEASDEVSALPYDYAYRSPPLRPVRSAGYLNSSANSSVSRLNSIRPLTQSRQNSFVSISLRPSSSGSVASNVVPSWAKRYYSGFYRDSFNYLYSNGSHLNLSNMAGHKGFAVRPNSSKSHQSTNIHQGMTDRIQAFFTPKKRPRPEARKSHILPGVGPLVSNPIRGPATAAVASNRVQSYPAAHRSSNHGRSISAPLHPADPRAHWAGVVEIHGNINEDGRGSSYTVRHHHIRTGSNGAMSLSSSQSVIHYGGRTQSRWSGSPHLHHDHRLNTGSSVSLGFGYPFNTKAKWTAPSITDMGSNFFGSADLRTAQVVLFTTGFLLPLTWFVAAFLPLPKRPDGLGDLEKRAAASAQYQAQLLQQQRSSRFSVQQLQQQQLDVAEWEQMDIVAKLRLERHAQGVEELRFQNARWWRNLNRVMCAVGLVVIVVVIVLAVLGAKSGF